MIGKHCIKTWSSTQKSITLSSGEAELVALQLEVAQLKAKVELEAQEANRKREADEAAAAAAQQLQELERIQKQQEELRASESRRLLKAARTTAENHFL